MSFIRTMLGDISKEELGVCASHDRLIRSDGEEVKENGNVIGSTEAAIQEFQFWLDAGGKSIVCTDSIGCGRNVPQVVEIAEAFRGKGNILMTTGFHKAAFYDKRWHWLNTVKDLDTIVDLMIAEIEVGLDKHSYNGPVVERVAAKAGMIMAGTGYGIIDRLEYKALTIAALTQQETGCPIQIQTQMGSMAYETAMYLEQNGADLSKVLLCHLQQNPDKSYHEKVLETGVSICYGGLDPENNYHKYPDNVFADHIKRLVDCGFQKQIVLSMDKRRITHLLVGIVPHLKERGVSQEAINDMLVHNTAEMFSFIEK